jgi:PIN domain nuclease of toxin-antitoxin system
LKLLLDTHIWIWSLSDPARLSQQVRNELRDLEHNELWLSAVSTWEALNLRAKGRIRLPEDLENWLAVSTQRMREAPLTHEIALAAHRLKWEHRDPADRFLAATAQVLGLILVTADARLIEYSQIVTLPNS